MVFLGPMLFWGLLALHGTGGCSGPGVEVEVEVERELILAKVKDLLLDALGPPAVTSKDGEPGGRRLHRRHALENTEEEDAFRGLMLTGLESQAREPRDKDEDVSQSILFPATGSSCEWEPGTGKLAQEAIKGFFTYVFRPSQHTRSRQVSSAQLWVHTRLAKQDPATSRSSEPQLSLLVLSPEGLRAVPVSLGQASPHWIVLRLDASALPLFTQPDLVFLLRCPFCSCSARPETRPFLTAHTRPRAASRERRHAPGSTAPLAWPWSPTLLDLLQRPPDEPSIHAHCHRAALNISFQELGWEHWIVHPPSFTFYYCHGTCRLPISPGQPLLSSQAGTSATPQPLSLVSGIKPCCASHVGTRKPLHVRTTSDGGYSFKYETIPNLITQDCACI
ncbi:inhibin alpha chain [Echinops telfairi]|uniref:Inhibin alpha chain n=1 Tax=Echinops telfairi TaxID=9371 RepID=A0ABM0IK65_ECHTE|nr:inhibin alpha chain [Echinops telfairi]